MDLGNRRESLKRCILRLCKSGWLWRRSSDDDEGGSYAGSGAACACRRTGLFPRVLLGGVCNLRW